MMTWLRILDTKRYSTADGFTMVEVLVAMAILVIGMLALMGAFDSARKLTLLSERRTEMAHRAQLEIERLQATPFSELAMKTTPSHSSETTNPDYYVTEGTSPEYQYGKNSETETAKLVISAKEEGAIATSPTGHECSKYIGACEWVNGNVSGNVYDFISRDEEKTVEGKAAKTYECTGEACPKRLTVVVTAKVGSGKPPASIRVSTVISEPVTTK